MGARHNTLNDTIFRNSKYMEMVNTQVGCKDFKKEYEEQYNFMLDTFKTLILLNNCFYSDSNLSLADKVAKALDNMEKYLYIDIDKKKYSVRFIQSIIEKHCTHLYRKIDEWYFTLEHLTSKDIANTNYVKNIMKDIEEEMTRLENIGFDDMVRGSIDYKKNKDSDYKIYISKFDTILYTENKAFIEEYKKDFNELYGINLTDKELEVMITLYILLAKANNGVVNILSNTEVKEYNLNEKSTPNDYYNAYLDTLNIKRDIKRIESKHFMFQFLLHYRQKLEPMGFTIDAAINNYDCYNFLIVMENLLNDDTFKPTNDIANGLYKNLKIVYELMNKSVSNSDEVIANYKMAYKEITRIINRHIDYFIRVS